MEQNKEVATELEFLQYFYSAAGECFGPADQEIYDAIKENFVKWKKKGLPDGYSINSD